MLASIVPVTAFFILLGWSAVGSGNKSGGFAVNSKLGEIPIDQRVAPDFLKQSLDGEMVSLSGLRGKVVMVDFWSSWCPPCRQEAPALAQVYREYEGKNIEFIGVIVWDDWQRAARYIQEFDLPYPNVLDELGEITIEYGVLGIPEKFFIDANGNVAQKFAGPMDSESLRAVLDGLLAP